MIGIGAVLRLLTEIAYGPALYFYDSVTYLAQANGNLFLNPDEPAGYPLAIRALRLGASDLALLTSAQHVAGLLAGVLVYVVVLRRSGSRALGAAGAAVVVLDGYAIAVEQYVMADAFFTALLIASAAFLLLGRRRATLLAAGLLLAAACVVRSTGLFCVPVWLAYAIWRYRWSWTSLVCAVAVLLPLAAYAAANDAKTGHFGLTDDTAWLIYGRIGPIGSCRGVSVPAADRILCPHGSQLDRSVNFYVNAPDSPAILAFGKPSIHAPPRVDRILLGYALAIMSARPLRYVGVTARSFLDFFLAGVPSDAATENGALTLPKPGPWLWPYYHPKQRWPAGLLRAYAAVVHTVRPLLGLFLLFGVAGLFLRPPPGLPARGGLRPAIALLTGMGAALLLGSALAHFELRYTLPAIPLLTGGGLLGSASILARVQGRVGRRRLTLAA